MNTAKENYHHNPDQVRIFDTTLRDGRQAPECDMSMEDAVKVAKALDSQLKVDVIEAGVPADQFEQDLVRTIGEETNYSTIAAFARAGVPADIESAFSVLKKPMEENRARITLLSRMAGRLRKVKGISVERAMDEAVDGIRQTIAGFKERGLPPDLQIYFEGASETPIDILTQVTRRVIGAVLEGVDPDNYENVSLTLDYPDTHGTAKGGDYANLIKEILPLLKDARGMDVVAAAHCHNDFGFALANSLAAVRAGARQMDGTILGIGERAGNADLIQAMGNLYYDAEAEGRPAPFRAQLNKAYPTASLVSEVVHQPIARNYPFIGRFAASAANGIHSDLQIKDEKAYNSINPKIFGAASDLIVLGSLQGKGGIEHVLQSEGLHLSKEVIKKVTADYRANPVRGITNKGFIHRFVAVPEVEDLMDTHIRLKQSEWQGVSGGEKRNHIKLHLTRDGQDITVEADSGKGNIAAAMKAFRQMLGKDFEIVDFHEEAVAKNGGDVGAEAEVIVRTTVRWNGETRTAYARDVQSTDAGISALCHAINSFSFWNETVQEKTV